MIGLIGRKVGMTRMFDELGRSISLTVVEAGPCPVVQVRTQETNGYKAIQLGYGQAKAKHLTKAQQGHFKKNDLTFSKRLREFSVENTEDYKVGDSLTVSIFQKNEKIDIVGTSKGRGFAGVVKRYGFKGMKQTHGTHESFRGPGSIGQCATPARVFKGKRMAGQMGNARVTVKNLTIFGVDQEKNLLFIKGAVPGARNGYVIIKKK